ncbi:MAG: phosphoglycolate phosphatase [Firmicutes bacterium HGW-Firmicutes-12]|jgi:phosphoglycolate phosphatase|nr:MAG: phosphoglycolate phosphatase [Firmicutes bacterium HGW-Firmicutes-12]
MIKYDTILFDLDGTLTEPKKGITRSFQYALKKFGIIEENMEVLLSFIGPPLKSTFINHYGFNEKKAWEAVVYYREYFTEKGMFENEVFLGISEMLHELKGNGKRVLLATSKASIYSDRILEYFNIRAYFDYIVGSNLDGTRAEKNEVISYALSLLDNKDNYTPVMVGDRKHDIIGAQQVGIDSIAVTYGYGLRQELEEAGATHILDTVDELKKFLLD